MSAALHKLTRKLEKLPADLSKLKESVAYSFNPNHRHDEDFEKEIDRIRTEIANSHRFQSFGAERDGNDVKWYVDGHDYFYALSELLDSAKETIWILDWWLTPELFLRRPPSENEQWRLDRLLLKKAEQGVKINIIVYKEVTQTMTMSSSHTKHHLEDMHDNISVMRHPDHIGGEITLYWSHHEKVVIVDNVYACIGGLDICFGRWDAHNHVLADVHPENFSHTVFAGQDYNNARVQDFQAVDHWVSNQQSRLETARMPWHDCHMMAVGPVVLDIAQHFVERWNFVRSLKYKHDPRFECLAFPHVIGEHDVPQQSIVRHPHLHAFKEMGKEYLFHTRGPEEGGHHPFGGLGPKGSMKVQCLRSSADWSSGILTEHSIQNAYCQMIAEANHFVYIENQFFITNTCDKGPVKNLIGKAIVERVLSAARAGKKFKVVIVIPAIPGFAGDLEGNSGTLAIMGACYNSICRGPVSIMGLIEKEGFNPHDYIAVYNLRSFDRINNDPAKLKRVAEENDIDFDHAQAALSRVFLGPDALADELEKNKNVSFALGIEGGEVMNLPGEKGVVEKGKKKDAPKTVEIPLPATYDEAWSEIRKFEQAARHEPHIPSSIAHLALKRKEGESVMNAPWSGSEDDERDAFVTEELYIHSKLLIVDDRRVLMGSANLNDRSQLGDHDSEIALVVEDTEQIQSRMDGQPYMATRFAATLRRQLWKEHLGLIEPQFCPPGSEEHVTSFMKLVGNLNEDVTNSPDDQLVADPISDETQSLWKGTAEKNANIFDDIFHCVPSKNVVDWKGYKSYVPQAPVKPGHVYHTKRPVREIKEKLDQIRGHLVAMPLNFLENENLLALDGEVNPVTLSIYL
ncbi:phospholipase D [Pseudohyphozyma bogoriensis]|nr:phospholipase D [Pseudohyphozyma bogoriensis]